MHYVAYRSVQKLGKTLMTEVASGGFCERCVFVGGLPGGTRTPDLRLRRPLLYPVELRADKKGPETKKVGPLIEKNGRSERIRTFDPLVPNQMRYQTALRSDKPHILMRVQAKSRNWMKKFMHFSSINPLFQKSGCTAS